jgi:hypothetical protein
MGACSSESLVGNTAEEIIADNTRQGRRMKPFTDYTGTEGRNRRDLGCCGVAASSSFRSKTKLRLAGICAMSTGNAFLPGFVEQFNEKF